MSSGRTPEEIRKSIEQNRAELANSIVSLRGEVVKLTAWRGKLAENRDQYTAAAAAAGFVIGGGVFALGGLMLRGRRKR